MSGPANSPYVPSPFPDPAHPDQPPYVPVPAPLHISNEMWQAAYYDATTHAPMGAFTQLAAGPCDVETGQLIDGDWPARPGLWKQV